MLLSEVENETLSPFLVICNVVRLSSSPGAKAYATASVPVVSTLVSTIGFFPVAWMAAYA